MSNVIAFKATEAFNTVTYRENEWSCDTSENQLVYSTWHEQLKDRGYTGTLPEKPTMFSVKASHDLGNQPFQSVDFEVYVSGRQSNEHFKLSKSDCEALRDMFANIANNMA